ncbi:sulfatase-like hydrolase/transferase [Paracoccus sp. 1_MG-2023]|uniref:sulfatase family protein n=1 Tax=unclassified Paracoccus (in: a-proteobacteria) TaxID=2688777 RepID=UPI001C09DD31|nr:MULTISPECIES: sulfatase-like hydrolase/transferase [unclassified Paracoccus (in: a-proteobacteria)]MBU2959131.1 sulfatase-like hydrolase/transferase [Paracoccus sp. C2R09]MDO6669415.1 sulfatase-like hydrolase/transferase [Paracoccus sp. 1_MG-2023]
MFRDVQTKVPDTMSDQKQPNFLWICTDQQRFDTIRALGNSHIHTPNLDRLVESGVTMEQAYCQNPVCTPSRASFLTGRYPRAVGVTRNGNDHFPDDEVLVPGILADHGYVCGLIGKLHLSSADGRTEVLPKNHGYDFVRWSHGPRDGWGDDNAYQAWLRSKGVAWEDLYKGRAGGIPAEHHQTTWCAEEAMGFIDANCDRPWLLSINIFDPHHPFDPPAEYKAKYPAKDMPLPKWREGELDRKPPIQRKDYEEGGQSGLGPACSALSDLDMQDYVSDYYAMIELIDVQLGRMIDHLEKRGLRDDTVIIFHSDHGEMLGDHGLILKGGHFYQELVHVPLILSCPARIRSDVKSPALTELVDIAPTILELAQVPVPYRMQGRSIAGLLRGQVDPGAHRSSVYCEYYDSLPAAHHGTYATMYFDGRYKVTVFHGQDVGELYDLKADPDEFENLWDIPDCRDLRNELVLRSFDRSIRTVEPVEIVGNF